MGKRYNGEVDYVEGVQTFCTLCPDKFQKNLSSKFQEKSIKAFGHAHAKMPQYGINKIFFKN